MIAGATLAVLLTAVPGRAAAAGAGGASPTAAAPTAPGSRTPPPPGSAAPPSSDPLDARRARIANELMQLGAELQREIQRGDVDAVLARVPPEGLRCGGQLVPRSRVERDLRGPSTWLHDVLFGPAGSDPAAPASLRGFFVEAKEIAILVAFAKDARAGPVGRPCLHYQARDLANPARPFCFEQRAGRWWLTQSLYPCP